MLAQFTTGLVHKVCGSPAAQIVPKTPVIEGPEALFSIKYAGIHACGGFYTFG
jgi:hypothetical protein